MFPFGVYSNGRPSHSIVGSAGEMRSGATSAVPAASATFVTILSALHRPEAREERLRRARDRRGLAAGVVADDGQRAAGTRDPDEVAVAERVGGAV